MLQLYDHIQMCIGISTKRIKIPAKNARIEVVKFLLRNEIKFFQLCPGIF